MQKKSIIISLFAMLNVVLVLVGYNFVTSIFAKQMLLSSQVITIPFRALTLGVALITIFLTYKSKNRIPALSKFLLFYWALVLLRFFYDMNFRIDINVDAQREKQILLYMVCLTIIPIIAVLKSYRYIDFQKLLRIAYIISSVSVVVTFLQNTGYQEAAMERLSANAALSTIGAGHMGLTNIILGFILIVKQKVGNLYKAIIIAIAAIALLVMLRSGSRGPVLALVLVSSFYIFGRAKYPFLGLILLAAAVFLTYTFFDQIIDWLEQISPILKQRLIDREDATSDRDPLFQEAWKIFLQNPLLGRDFALYGGGNMMYPHNIFLESLMQLGLVGGIILFSIIAISLKYSYSIIRLNSPNLWLALLFIQSFSNLLVSGTFSMDPTFSILIVIISFLKVQGNNQLETSKIN